MFIPTTTTTTTTAAIHLSSPAILLARRGAANPFRTAALLRNNLHSSSSSYVAPSPRHGPSPLRNQITLPANFFSSDYLTRRGYAAVAEHNHTSPGGGGDGGGGGASSSSSQQPPKSPEPLEIERVKDSYVMDHHIYQKDHLDTIDVLHHTPKGISDRIAWLLVKTMRTVFDLATRYPSSHTRFPPMAKERQGDVVVKKDAGEREEKSMTLKEMRDKGFTFGPDQWLTRFIFLESVAGVPGMVAGTARHLHSLRLLRRDRGWIATCLEDSENERVHLLSFLAIRQPGVVMRGLLLLTQGFFYNFLFLFYLLSPKTVHRFVGILEEEAVYTYTRVIQDLQAGRLPEWEQYPAPEIGKEYWKLAEDAKMIDMLKVIRADEAGHRFIHHTLANLDQKMDTNPFSIATPSPHMIGTKLNLSRDESLRYIQQAKEMGKAKMKLNE